MFQNQQITECEDSIKSIAIVHIMETKDQLMNGIREWVQTDNALLKLKAEARELNSKKKELTERLVNVMKQNEIDCFDIKGGSISYKKNVVKKPITGKTLMNVLSQYYKDDPNVAEELTKYVMTNREEQVKETIKRKIDK
jgi:hypothetical protein